MGLYRIGLKFKAQNIPFSEGYALDGPASYEQAENVAVPMIKERIKLCGNGVRLLGVRISAIPATRKIRVVLPHDAKWNDPSLITAADDGPEVQRATSTVNVDFFDANGNRTRKYMSGIPDKLISETASDGLRFDRVPGWKQQFDRWRSYLIGAAGVPGGSWGFVGLPAMNAANSNAILEGTVDNATGELIVWVSGDHQARYPAGMKVIILNNRREVAAYKSPNGKHVVRTVQYDAESDSTGVTLRKLTGVDPTKWLVGSEGVIRLTTPATFYGFADVKVNRAGRRDRREENFSPVRGRGRTRRSV